jgi:DNA-directed RNA polymerase sigma subunit (sigma70/sigma32)
MVPLPQALSAIGTKSSVSALRAIAARLSKDERRVHHFVVREMAIAEEPITLELIGERLNLSVRRVADIVDKLESLKTFFYRNDSDGINWAYPLSLEDTGHEMIAGTGERFFAA